MTTKLDIPECRLSPLQGIFEDVLRGELAQKEKRFPLSPSNVLTCKRKLSYELINYDSPGSIYINDFSVTQLLLFDNGHRVEKRLADWLAKIPDFEVIENKERFTIYEEDGLKITGELDRILLDKVDGNKKKLWDAKSINEMWFKGVKNTKKPVDKNFIQQQMYLHSPFLQEQGINTAILHYENKNTQEMLMLEFDYQKEWAEWGIEVLKYVWKTRGMELPRDYVFGKDWQCGQKYCPYHLHCYRGLYHKNPEVFEVTGEDEYLENITTPKIDIDKMDMVKYLLAKAPNHSLFKYKNKLMELDMLKTTISISYKDI